MTFPKPPDQIAQLNEEMALLRQHYPQMLHALQQDENRTLGGRPNYSALGRYLGWTTIQVKTVLAGMRALLDPSFSAISRADLARLPREPTRA